MLNFLNFFKGLFPKQIVIHELATVSEIKHIMKCPIGVELRTHLENINKVVEAKRREQIVEALQKLDDFEPDIRLMDNNANHRASAIFMNPEFTRYTLNKMDKVRNMALINGDNENLKGRLIELSEVYNFFKMTYNKSKSSSPNKVEEDNE